MPIPIWAGKYIGLPFKEHGRDRAGLDCWGLVRLVQLEQFDRALPTYATHYRKTTDVRGIGDLIKDQITRWTPVDAGDEQAGDIIILRMHGAPMHVGLVLGFRRMLHVEQGISAAIERYDGLRWKDSIHGFYRYDIKRTPYLS